MGQLKFMPQTNVLALRAGRAWPGKTNGAGQAKANGHQLGATEAGLEPTPQRLELVKAYAKTALRGAQAPSASQIAQRFAPRAEGAPASGAPRAAPHAPAPAPFAMLASRMRRLAGLVIVAALLPNLTLAAFWLRLIDPPWSKPEALAPSESHLPAAQPGPTLPVLSAPATLDATAGEDVPLPIALDGTDGVPPGSVIAVRGLPPGATLSAGRPADAGDWILRPGEIGDLRLVPAGAARDEALLAIELRAPNDGILADATTILRLAGNPMPAAGDAAAEAETAGSAAPDRPVDELEVGSIAPNAAATDEPTSLSEPVPLPARRPVPGTGDGAVNWVRPSAYVNLRDGPSSTARVVSVVAKGAKLRVVARKRGWVQVADPATAQSGWIYSDYVETGP